MSKPLPSHWASVEGLGGRPSFPVSSEPVSVRRARQKAAAAAIYEAGRGRTESACFQTAQPSGLVGFSTSQTEPPAGGVVAGEVVEFSQSEARIRKLGVAVREVARIHAAAARAGNAFAPAARELPAMFTLTHRPGQVPAPGDVTRFVDCVRKWCLRRFGWKVLRYVWVAELQAERAARGDKGAVHYHVVIWLPPELMATAQRRRLKHLAAVLPKPDVKGWWKKGITERDWVRKNVGAYLSKYLSKGSESLAMPKGLRTYGQGGLDAEERSQRTWACAPTWLQMQTKSADRIARLPAGFWVYPDGRREPGGGWFSRATGECFRSPWRLLSFGRIVRIVRVEQCNAKTEQPDFMPLRLAA